MRARTRRQTDQPIRGLLCTHSHYVRGTATLLENDQALIDAHPTLEAAVGQVKDPARAQVVACRMRLETGENLPVDGPLAVVAPTLDWPGESAFLPPHHRVLPGDGFTVSGSNGCAHLP